MKNTLFIISCLALVGFTPLTAFAQMDTEMDYVDNGASAVPLPQVHLIDDKTLQKIGCDSITGAIQHQYCSAVYEVDLSGIFHTPKKSIFVALENSGATGSITLCFIQDDDRDCHYKQWGNIDYGELDALTSAFIIYPSAKERAPIFLTNLYMAGGGSGCPPNVTVLWVYDHRLRDLRPIFHWSTDCLEEMRFETTGKMAGDMILSVDDPTRHYPWPWGIQVYKFIEPDRYVKVLDFIGKDRQAGGNNAVFGVIDTDMPEIMNRLRIAN